MRVIAGIAGLATMLVLAPGALATFPGANGPIAVQRLTERSSGTSDVVRSDTGSPVDGTCCDLIAQRDPAWGPDGRRIAYVSTRDGGQDLYVSTGQTSSAFVMARVVLRPRLVVSGPAWAPDGRRIVLAGAASAAAPADLWVVEVDAEGGASGLRRITATPFAESSPDWSPKGDVIAYAADPGGGSQVFLVGPSGGAARQLTSPGPVATSGASPSFSPDGTRLAWTGGTLDERGRATTSVVTGPSDGSGPPAVLAAGTAVIALSEPVWSPDGTQVAFVRLGQLVTVPAAGGTPTTVMAGNPVSRPDWGVAPGTGRITPSTTGGGAVVRCRVPQVRGLTVARARARLRSAGCPVDGVTRTRGALPAGRVLRSVPPAATRVRGSAQVRLVVSRGPR